MKNLTQFIANLRSDYQKAKLDENSCAAQPWQQFELWLQEAVKQQLPEPCAMTIATTGADLKPSTRVVLLKGYDEKGLQFFTNYNSRKAQQIAVNNQIAAQFFWPQLERVVRIEGTVEKLSRQQSDEYFAGRPLKSRLGAWASEQSSIISSRAHVMQRFAQYAAQFGLHPPRPPHWGGYNIIPTYWEFWQGRPSRLHDRIIYRQTANQQWSIARLAP